MNRWFGEPWPSADRRAPICDDDAERIAVPVGEPCLWCTEAIAATDRGVTMPYLSETGAVVVYIHIECHVRSVVGSIGHLRGECSCYGGTAEDPPGVSRRQAALEAAVLAELESW